MHVYEVRPRSDHRGVDLISDALPFGRLRCDGGRMRSAMQSTTPSFAAAQIKLWSDAGNAANRISRVDSFGRCADSNQ